MNTVADTSVLLTLLVSALVTDKNAVEVVAEPNVNGQVTFKVAVAAKDRGKVLGSQGRMARSLRFVLFSIGKEHGTSFLLDICEAKDCLDS